LPEREIMTGIGSVAVRQPRVRDREAVGSERIRFSPTILPPYAPRKQPWGRIRDAATHCWHEGVLEAASGLQPRSCMRSIP
jgi:hypothetical protein